MKTEFPPFEFLNRDIENLEFRFERIVKEHFSELMMNKDYNLRTEEFMTKNDISHIRDFIQYYKKQESRRLVKQTKI